MYASATERHTRLQCPTWRPSYTDRNVELFALALFWALSMQRYSLSATAKPQHFRLPSFCYKGKTYWGTRSRTLHIRYGIISILNLTKEITTQNKQCTSTLYTLRLITWFLFSIGSMEAGCTICYVHWKLDVHLLSQNHWCITIVMVFIVTWNYGCYCQLCIRYIHSGFSFNT